MARDFYYRKYNTGFAGKKYLGFIAYNAQNKPVAFSGAVPCFVANGDVLMAAAQCADAMTHPKYRLQGLFTKLCSMVAALCKNEDVAFLFGFPSHQAKPALVNKLGWQQHGHMENFTIAVNAIPFKGFVNRLRFINGLYGMFERHVIAKYVLPEQGVANSILCDGYGGVYRNSSYLNYKAFSRTLVVKAGKSKVWVALGYALLVGDISLQGDIDEVIQVLKKLAARLGIGKISFLTSVGTSLHNLLSVQCPPSKAFPVVFQTMGNSVEVYNIKFAYADLDVF